jgi:ABC-type sulfate transport system permease component
LYDTSTRPAAVQIAEHARTDPHAAYGLALCLMALSAAAITLANVLQRRAR